jgi:Domain of unknown function (DU1801)
MAKAELKTKATAVTVGAFIAGLPDARRRDEAGVIDALHRRVTGMEPKMWGPSIDYKYDSGREGTMCRTGFSPRKAALTLYAMGGPAETPEGAALFARLGKHTAGKGCLYIKKLSDVDLEVLERLVALSWQCMNEKYPG